MLIRCQVTKYGAFGMSEAGEVVTKQTRGRESVGDKAAEPRAGKGV